MSISFRAGRRAAAAALLCLTSSLALQAAPQVIIKADDLRYVASTTVDARWQRFADTIEQRRLRAAIGIITNSLESAGPDYYEWIRSRHRGGRIEFWHHGYDHSRDPASSTAWWEYKNTGYAAQKESFERGMTLAREKLGLTFRTFGSPYNQTDADTVQVLEENSDLRVWLYPSSTAGSSKLALARIGALNIEPSTGVIAADSFIANYPNYDDEAVLVLQCHPGQWDEGSHAEFIRIVEFLIAQGASFTTPFAYYRETNGIPYAILKADNIEYNLGSGTPNATWQRFLDFLRDRNLKATAGVRGDTLEDVGGVNKAPYYTWLRDAAGDGTFEYFLYGYDHSRDSGSPTAWWEFRNTDYAFQKEHFTRTAQLVQEKLDITLRAFGASWNQTDETTVRILEESPDIKVWLYGNPAATTTKLVLRRISQINIEQPVHEPNSAYLISNYPTYKNEPVLVLQGHPADWDTEASFAEFVAIVDYLTDQGVVFVTPSEYYDLLYPTGEYRYEFSMLTELGARYRWERSYDLKTWENWGSTFSGNGQAMGASAVFYGESEAFFRRTTLAADAPLVIETFESLSAFNDISPSSPTATAGVTLADATTTPANLAGPGSGMRFFDYSTSASVRALQDIVLPKAFKLEVAFYNHNVDSTDTFQGPTLRFGNTGASLASSTNATFYINFRKDNAIRAYYFGNAYGEVQVSPGAAHTLTIYVNADTTESVTYEGPSAARTLGPMTFDAYVNGVRIGTAANGLPFMNPSGYTPANGIGRFGFNTSSTHTGADFSFDNLIISPLPLP